MATKKPKTQTATATPTALALAAAQRVAPYVKLGGVAQLQGAFELALAAESVPAQSTIVPSITQIVKRDGPNLFVNTQFTLQAVAAGIAPHPNTLIAQATFQVGYELPAECKLEAKDLEVFAKLNGLYNTWAYWREFVQSSTARLGLPPLALPLLTPDAAVVLADLAR